MAERSSFDGPFDLQPATTTLNIDDGADIVDQVERWRQGAAKTTTLTKENQKLREQLQRLQGSLQTTDSPPSGWEGKYIEQKQRYDRLVKTHAQCEPFLNRASEKVKAAKQSVKKWQDYIDGHKAELDSLRSPNMADSRPSIEGAGDLPGASTLISGTSPCTPDAASKDQVLKTDLPQQSRGGADASAGHARARFNKHGRSSRRVTSSQTTEGESGPHGSLGVGLRDLHSDDEPAVVSVKSLKRKRGRADVNMPPPTSHKREDGSQAAVIHIKSEDFSSPKGTLQLPCTLQRKETSDLDAVGDLIDTPHKRQQFGMRRKSQLATIGDRPFVRQLVPPSLSQNDEDMLDAVDGDNGVHDYPLLRTHSFSDGDVPSAPKTRRPPYNCAKIESESEENVSATGSTKGHAVERALRPLDLNVPPLLRSSSSCKQDKLRRRPDYDRGAAKLAFISEDGDEHLMPIKTTSVSKLKPSAPNNGIHQRLGTLLEAPSPSERLPLSSRSNELLDRRAAHPAPDKMVQTCDFAKLRVPPACATKQTPLQEPQSSFRLPRGLGTGPASIYLEDEPLRARPPNTLKIEDFRVNPRYQESDFAFADTIRGRDQRRCLPGCTLPACCGNAFLKAVAIAGAPIVARKPGLFDSSQESPDNDAQLLQDYLGPEYAEITAVYGATKRQGLLAQARAQAFANEHGKHRQAFQRRSTPPGFWRTDMPTTQEDTADRLKAQMMIKKKVEERWQEAMREGGRWIFRDE